MAVAIPAPGPGALNGSDRRSSSGSARSFVSNFIPLVSVVDFHHARGPEVERWFGVAEGFDPAAEFDWSLLPFMALSDGAHTSTEDFSYFTLLKPATDSAPATSLFGISCTRQMDASQLKARPSDVTRSTVQKAVVVIADGPRSFGMLRERLSMVTKAWFAQREFSDVEILRRFQESLAEEKERGLLSLSLSVVPGELDEDQDQHLGLSLRELVREFRWQTLVLFKCCLLQPKMLFFGSRCERLCMTQFSLISLIPGLLRCLQDCAGPELNSYEENLIKPTSVRTSDRNSLLSYMGLPLQIFGKGSLYGPYTPLQQLDILADFGTKSYIVGSTNSLLLQQRDRYSDILINLDENTVSITSTSLKTALYLSSADRRWIESITAEVNDTWDDANPSRPKTMGYRGSEESIRLQFEDYIKSLLSAVKYHNWLARHKDNPRMALPHIEGDPSVDFNPDWVDAWARTENYRIWNTNTDETIFDFHEPKHPCASGLSRLAQQMQDLGLDERLAATGVVIGRGVAAGREKASTLLNKLYADVEALREGQRKRSDESRAPQQPGQGEKKSQERERERDGSSSSSNVPATPTMLDPGRAGQAALTMGSKAGAYASSWAAWAGEKRKAWVRGSAPSSGGTTPTTAMTPAANSASTSVSGGWSLVGRSSKRNTSSSFASSATGLSSTTSDTASEKDFLAAATLRSPSSSVTPSPDTAAASLNNEKGPASPQAVAPVPAPPPTGIDSVLASKAAPAPMPAEVEVEVAQAEGQNWEGRQNVEKDEKEDTVNATNSTAITRETEAEPEETPETPEGKPTPAFPVIDTDNVWAEEIPSPIIVRKRTPEPDVPAPVGSKITLIH